MFPMPFREARMIPSIGIWRPVNSWSSQNFRGWRSTLELPFPTMSMEKKRYKIFGIVTNRDLEGSELINWLHKRCGKSEEAHSIMKEDLAGGKLPSSAFGENAAWWWIMILAFNLELGDETAGTGGILGFKTDESHPVFPDWAAGTSGEACARAYRQTRKGSSLAGGIGESETANYGAWLCTVRVANTAV